MSISRAISQNPSRSNRRAGLGDVNRQLTRLRDWFVDATIPLWERAGYDHEKGGFHEALDWTGAPIAGRTRRVRVQSRQIYTFSKCAERGWTGRGEALARDGFAYLLDHACPDGAARGCVHLIDQRGDIVDDKRDLYDQAFLMLAAAARGSAGDTQAPPIAQKTMAFLRTELASPHGGYIEDDRASLPRRANPHMHLLESFLALSAAAPANTDWKAAAAEIVSLFHDRLFDREAGVLREFFTEDWSLAPSPQGDVIEPGHMMEWAYLLQAYASRAQAPLSPVVSDLIDAAEARADGVFLPNAASTEREDIARDRRLWPQTEYLRTLIWRLSDGARVEERISALITALFDTYLNVQTKGLWCDEFDEHGVATAKDVPASILYHLYEAVAVADDYLNAS